MWQVPSRLSVAVLVGVVLGGFLRVMGGMDQVAMRDVRVMAGRFVFARLVLFGGDFVMAGGLLVVFGGLLVMLYGGIRHGVALLQAKLSRCTGTRSRA
jgi:hypothetical protein